MPTSSTSTSTCVALDLGLEDGGDLVGSQLHLDVTSHFCSSQPAAQLADPCFDAAVDDDVADAQDEAAEDGGVDAPGQLDPAPGCLLDTGGDLLLGVGLELGGRGDLDFDDALFDDGEGVVGLLQLRHGGEAAALEHELQGVGEQRLAAAGDLDEHPASGAGVDLRVGEDVAQRRGRRERGGELTQLAARRLHDAGLLGGVEQGLGVHPSDLFFAHALPSAPSFSASSSASTSSMSRCWSAADRLLAATFSVASAVSSAI